MRLLVKWSLFVGGLLLNLAIVFSVFDYFLRGNETLFLQQKKLFWENNIFLFSFYLHIAFSPILITICGLLVIFRIEKSTPKLHKFAGYSALFIASIALPSGLALSYFAEGGVLGKFTFFMLSVYTIFTFSKAIIAIKNQSIIMHQFWMIQTILLLSSAFLLRLFLLFASQLQLDSETSYNVSAILSWIPSVLAHFWMKRKLFL